MRELVAERGVGVGVVGRRAGLAVVAMLGEDERGAETLGALPHDAGGVEVELDVRLVTGVEEEHGVRGMRVATAQEVTLAVGGVGREGEVVEGGVAPTLVALGDGRRDGGVRGGRRRERGDEAARQSPRTRGEAALRTRRGVTSSSRRARRDLTTVQRARSSRRRKPSGQKEGAVFPRARPRHLPVPRLRHAHATLGTGRIARVRARFARDRVIVRASRVVGRNLRHRARGCRLARGVPTEEPDRGGGAVPRGFRARHRRWRDAAVGARGVRAGGLPPHPDRH